MLGEIEGAGRDPADLDHAGQRPLARPHSAHLLGRSGASFGRGAARRFLRLRLGPLCAGDFARRLRQSRAAPSTAIGRCRSASARAITLENRDPDADAIVYWQINYALTDVPEDAAYFHAQFRRTNPLPFKQDYVVLDGVTRRAAITSGPTSPGASTTPAGGARARSSSSSTATNGRRSAAPAPRTISAAPTTSTPARSTRPSRAPTSNSPRPMPACRRSSGPTGPISRSSASASTAGTSWIRSASRRTCKVTLQAIGWRTEKDEAALSAAAGRHRLRRLLVSDAADSAVSGAAGPRLSRNHLARAMSDRSRRTIPSAPTRRCSAS